ncbi:hypothetical protein VTN00DRAFT_880 [Thermoascus crustaceus]|uniref:uncharacterized protein n=1 Tax=Thermoascus crustaceus TaxID=5088 RepID=UPI0037433210
MPDETNLADLERQRLELEQNVRKLQQSLYHWRLWEAEYDGLKEELASLRDGSTRDDFLSKGREFGGSLVTEDEVRVLLGEKQGLTRSKEQVVQLISRRIDYVKQNVATMEKRLHAAEDRLNRLLNIETPRDVVRVEGEDGAFPVTEILEELDEEGNVIKGSTTTPGEKAPELLEVLKKAGVKDIPEKIAAKKAEAKESKSANVEEVSESESELEQPKQTPKQEPKKEPEQELKQGPKQEPKQERKPEPKPESQREQKQEQKPEKPVPIQTPGTTKQPEKPASSQVNRASDTSTKRTSVSVEKPEKDEDERPVPVTDIDESPEDAKLRREMLQYGLNEVGAVVAELELDENASDISIEDEDYDSYEDIDPDDDEDEEEDEYGRTTRRVLTDEYHQQMRELERKLNARGMFNVGRDTSSLPEEVRRELEAPRGVVKVERSEASGEAAKVPEKAPEEKKPKKKVAFAPELDIAPDPQPPVQQEKTAPRQPETPPVSESIVERTEPVKEQKPAAPQPPKKVSRFKSSRAAGTPAETATPAAAPIASTVKPTVGSSIKNPDPSSLPLFPAKPKEPKPFSQPIATDIIEKHTLSQSQSESRPSEPRPPEGKTLADTLVERDVSEGSAAPPEPDELDEELHRKEIATEFYRMRNRMIHRSGGFVNDDERETVPLDEDEEVNEDGKPKRRVSRFMAARMR